MTNYPITFEDHRFRRTIAARLKRIVLPHLNRTLTFFFVFVLGAPLLCIVLAIAQAALSGSGRGANSVTLLIGDYAGLLFSFLIWSFDSISRLSVLSSSPVFNALILASAGASVYFLIRNDMSLKSPCSFTVSENGIERTWLLLDLIPLKSTTAWNDIASIRGKRSGKRGAPDRQLVFYPKSGKPFELNRSFITQKNPGAQVLDAVARLAPAGLLQDLDDDDETNPISYTKIWLSSLSRSGTRERRSELIEGTRLGKNRFTVIKKLGAGGQGTAYLAELESESALEWLEAEPFASAMPVSSTKPDSSAMPVSKVRHRLVVLKEFILPGSSNLGLAREIIASIQHEALLLKRLDHPAIIGLVDFFIDDLRAYLVLEHATGQSLRSLVAENGSLPAAQVRDIASELLDILDYLHGQAPPVVHRDFTPDNLLLTEDGQVKLIDFNLALSCASPQTMFCVGKPSYMAPEQLQGTCLPESDLYALGATLAFLLSGRDPEPLTQVSQQEIERPGTQTGDLTRLITALTSQDLHGRPQSARAARALLSGHGAAHMSPV